MSNWKRLTSTTGTQIDINLDAVPYLHPSTSKGFTTVYFTVGDHGKLFGIGVKESLDGIHGAGAGASSQPAATEE
jgi:hypothetical protein